VLRENQLKLAVAPADLARLASEAFKTAGVRANARKLTTVYYDTPRLGLWQRGIALRVRHDGSGWTQSVAGVAPGKGSVNRRLCAASPLAGPEPDLSRIADPQLAAAAQRATGRAALKPLFRTEIVRRVCPVSPAPDSAIELRFDRGTIRAGPRREPICEIELAAKEGPPWRLYDLALTLEERAPVRVEQRSRAERGYALARAGRSSPVKARVSVVREEMTAVEAFREICFVCLEHLHANREGMLAGADPEYLHQMRVALRRLRSAFSVFSRALPKPATRPPLEEIQWLLGTLGPARDWDVLIAESVSPLLAQLPGHHGLIAMQRAFARRRADAQRAARRAVASRRYQRLLLGLAAWLASESWASLVPLDAARTLRQPVREYAAGALARRYRQVRRRGRGFARLGARELHRLRIAVKKLRYTTHFFAPLFPARRASALLGSLEALQDALGGINDCATAARLFREARAGARGVMLREAQDLLAGWKDTALAEHRRQLKAAWKAFRATERYWKR